MTKNLDYLESYDAIVVGTGISGGWAAKELCENGLKTLVLERGRMVKHIEGYPTANLDPWDLPNGGAPKRETRIRKFKQDRDSSATDEDVQHFFVDDIKHPYNEDRRFDWIRGYHVGGRSIMWGRHSYRLSDLDFEANKKEGIAIDWPVRYKDIAPWYDHVEEFIGVSGENLGLSHFPDQKLLKPMPLNCIEEDLKGVIKEKFNDRVLTVGRVAHITEGTKPGMGRSTCQFRNRCKRGCPFGAYFSSNSSTLPTAEATGNMTLRPNSIVYEVVYDEQLGKATGVKVIDSETNEKFEFNAKIIFLCASAIASASILLQSKSKRFPNGLGNDSGELGHNIMDHHFKVGAKGIAKGYEDKYYKGRRPTGTYMPRFRNIGGDTNQKSFLRGYGFQGGASRSGTSELVAELKYGAQLKEEILKPGEWQMDFHGFGETLPNHDNRMYLNYEKKDKWGLPTVTFDAGFGENELAMREDIKQQAVKMLEAGGFKDIKTYDEKIGMGLGIHEMGTARMGHDPKTSVLNKYNQIHACTNVYVTDGSFMTSAGNQNPSLTYMAFTARAANYAAEEFKKTNA
ncbi:GMC family oxidoreductase [Yeosuana sp. MJ-SS3]|uniref:GMC family oxidoreductase n=1 Tax=Gilvirhabdus luticola TaxID=3079858 RepID=A0ABU3U5Y5_9FLAO|nr:GMC family oxidoreductase [Yeosuana sp. MJ-SS3]MDU8885818.1 GMC family oxidoreductase [Yeosuana sp. MJ-SS3]